MNMFKKNGGFTLVELIVVIAILAILAGIAVPAYSGYITKANEAADMTQLDSFKTAAVFAATEKHSDAQVTKIVVTETSVLVDYTIADGDDQDTERDAVTNDDLTTEVHALTNGAIEFKSGKSTATLDLNVDQPKWVLS